MKGLLLFIAFELLLVQGLKHTTAESIGEVIAPNYMEQIKKRDILLKSVNG